MVCVQPHNNDHAFCAYKGWIRCGLIISFLIAGLIAVFFLIAIWVYVIEPLCDWCVSKKEKKRNYKADDLLYKKINNTHYHNDESSNIDGDDSFA